MSHAKFSPSSAKRWISCPGSVRLSEGRPNPDSDASLHGTLCHEVAAKCLEDGSDAVAHIGYVSDDPKLMRFTFQADDATNVQVYLDYVRGALRESFGGRLLVEQKVHVNADCWGTTDAAILTPTTLEVIDLKMGSGHFVAVEGNKQAGVYALAMLKDLPFAQMDAIKKITLTIVQPRRPDSDGRVVRSAEVTREELQELHAEIDEAIQLAKSPDAPVTPGDHCTFCLAAAVCPALRSRALAVAQSVFDDGKLTLQPPEVTAMSPKHLQTVLNGLPVLEAWIAQVYKHAESVARTSSIPGYKLVEKIGHRRWKNPAAAAETLRQLGLDPFEEPSLISPAAAEKKGGKKAKTAIDGLTERPVTGTVLVHDADPRPAINVAAKFLGDLLD